MINIYINTYVRDNNGDDDDDDRISNILAAMKNISLYIC